MCNGVSPAEQWAADVAPNSAKALKKLPEDARYLLASHRRAVAPTKKGIPVTVQGRTLYFYNERTGNLRRDQKVMVYWHLEYPHLITVTDMNGQNAFSVKAPLLPAMDATKEQFAKVRAAKQGHMQAARALYGRIGKQAAFTITRDQQHSDEERALGRAINADIEEDKKEERSKNRKLNRIREALPGVDIHNIRNADRVQEGIRREKEALAKIHAKEKGVGI